MNSFFEITFVEDQEPFFQLGNLPVYKLRVSRFEYSSEEINTGQEILDQAEDKFSLNTLNHKVGLESGQVALTGDGSIELEDYFDRRQYIQKIILRRIVLVWCQMEEYFRWFGIGMGRHMNTI